MADDGPSKAKRNCRRSNSRALSGIETLDIPNTRSAVPFENATISNAPRGASRKRSLGVSTKSVAETTVSSKEFASTSEGDAAVSGTSVDSTDTASSSFFESAGEKDDRVYIFTALRKWAKSIPNKGGSDHVMGTVGRMETSWIRNEFPPVIMKTLRQTATALDTKNFKEARKLVRSWLADREKAKSLLEGRVPR